MQLARLHVTAKEKNVPFAVDSTTFEQILVYSTPTIHSHTLPQSVAILLCHQSTLEEIPQKELIQFQDANIATAYSPSWHLLVWRHHVSGPIILSRKQLGKGDTCKGRNDQSRSAQHSLMDYLPCKPHPNPCNEWWWKQVRHNMSVFG